MLVTLLRHALAEPRTGDEKDPERHLTVAGRRQMEAVSASLMLFLPNADAIYTSPTLRCRETAECLANAYSCRLPVIVTSILSPDARPAEFVRLLDGVDAKCAYFVGHEPHLTTVMLLLTRMSAKGEHALTRCGCYGLTYERGAGQGTLRWVRY
jgi:phosphohistidine phosphatase SixA